MRTRRSSVRGGGGMPRPRNPTMPPPLRREDSFGELPGFPTQSNLKGLPAHIYNEVRERASGM